MTRTLLVAAGAHTLAADVAGRAVLLDGDRIAWVGDPDAEVPPHDVALDLGGAWLTPSFVDAHVHATATGLALRGADLAGAVSLAEAMDRLRSAATTHGAQAAEGGSATDSDDPVLIGTGWDDFGWPEGRAPSAADVTAAAPGQTVLLLRVDAHSCTVDPVTLSRLPLDALGAHVDRDRDGLPTGLLREAASEAAQQLVRTLIPSAQVDAARLAACRRAASLGIGSLHEMGHPGLSGMDDARAWAAGEWPVEVLVWWAELDLDVCAAAGLRPGGDLFLDGSIGSRTAAVQEPYDDGTRGVLFHADDAVAAFFTACTRAGLGAGVHAIGGRAVEQALVALEAAVAACGADAVRACRHRIEHVELPSPAQVERLGRLGLVASVQPVFDALWGGDGALYASRFGVAAAKASNPFSALAAAGAVLALGSDSTVTPLDPWGAVVAAQGHLGGNGISRSAAFEAHTLGGRFAAGQDDVGPLRPGARADLAVWSADPAAIADPRTLQCVATAVAGRWPHGERGFFPSR